MDTGTGNESGPTLLPRVDRDQEASCAACSNSGIKVHGGREWRCGLCQRTPARPLRADRLYDDLESRAAPVSNEKPDGDIGSRSHPCGVQGCPEVTSGKKPFCQEHLDRLGHASGLKAAIEAREREHAAVLSAGDAGWTKVDLEGSTAKDILSLLETQGAQSAKELAKLMSVNQFVIRAYVAALKKAGLVRLTVNEASSIVALPDQG
jgi:hypothetical protein